MKFDFDDILLVPETVSMINSRTEVDPFDENGFLPIMTAPMDTVVDKNNYNIFRGNNIRVVFPRGINQLTFPLREDSFFSYSLSEFEQVFLVNEPKLITANYALIDVANGHMSKIQELINKAKNKYGNELIIMVGNIANPLSYTHLNDAGADYIRCGIGGGQACLTSVQTGVGYPMASLINETYKLKLEVNGRAKIVADGGFKSFSDINKALALGADYVMLGSMLNKALESCGENFIKIKDSYQPVDNYLIKFLKQGVLYKKFRGMSTKEVQRDWGRETLKTSEGISKYNLVEYTLSSFVENLEDYLRSAMSYTNSRDLNSFKNSNFTQISPASFRRFNK